MTISSLLTPELVLPALPAQAKAQVLEALAAHVGLVHPHVDARRLADALHERERQSTTALEDGVAIPHVRLAGLPGPLAALAACAARSPRSHGPPPASRAARRTDGPRGSSCSSSSLPSSRAATSGCSRTRRGC